MIVGRKHTERWGKIVGTDDGAAIERDGRGPCFVAFHGFTGTTSEIRPMVEAVHEKGYAVRAPLLPGHGSRASELQDATFETWTSAMAREVDAARERYGRVVIAGFSLGSLVAMELASRRPGGLDGLVVLGNALTLSPPVRVALGLVDRAGWTLPDWYLVKLWSSDLRDPEHRKRVAAYDRDPLRAALEVYRGGVRVRSRLGAIDCPTLVLHGALDRVCPSANVELVRRSLGTRNVRTRIYARSGHLVAYDHDRAEVASTVASFVDSLASAR